MTQEELNEVLRLHKQWLESNGNKGKRADMRRANLKNADMRGADMRGADMHRADMKDAKLQNAYLYGAHMQDADMRGADMKDADMKDAKLQGADMRGADMRGADLKGTDMKDAKLQNAYLDYSAWPLWCGSFDVKCDIRLASQLAYHFCRLDCKDKEVVAAQNALITLANKFHRVEECGVLKPKPTLES